jgi:hypothetical protein
MKEKIIYQEKFQKPYMPLNNNYLPDFPSVETKVRCCEALIMGQGVSEKGGKNLDFVDMRIYFEER